MRILAQDKNENVVRKPTIPFRKGGCTLRNVVLSTVEPEVLGNFSKPLKDARYMVPDAYKASRVEVAYLHGNVCEPYWYMSLIVLSELNWDSHGVVLTDALPVHFFEPILIV